MKKKLIICSFLFSICAVLAACGTDKTGEPSADKLQVVTTFYPMYEFTKQVVGEEAEVTMLIDGGVDAHDYEPSAKELAKLTEADVFVYNSPSFETWVEDVIGTLSNEKTTIIEAAAGIELLEGTDDHEAHDDHDHSHELDPHVWLSPALAIKEVQTIEQTLSEKYPEYKAKFSANAQAYIEELSTLDEAYQTAFTNAENRTFVTQHASFGYLAHEYDLEQVAIAGLSPDIEPTASRLAELKEFVVENQISVIYFENNASSAVAETLASETGVETLVLNSLESLSTEQMEQGENYISVMKANLTALQKSIK